MLKRISLLISVVTAFAFTVGWLGPRTQDQNILPNNQCVRCHSKISDSVALSSKYFEWHVSLHRDNAVGCDKCHGGDPTKKNANEAHPAALKLSDAKSRIHPANLPNACTECHSEVVSSFVESVHYQKLKATVMGPSCSTCHAHMASSVVQTPTEAAALCAHCHNTLGGPMPARPDIPETARIIMESLNRANGMIVWADRLLEVGKEKNLDLSEETREMKLVKTLLTEAKVAWHALAFESVKKKADESFELGSKVKDQVMKKLYPQPGQ